MESDQGEEFNAVVFAVNYKFLNISKVRACKNIFCQKMKDFYYNDGYGRQIFTSSSYLNTPTFSSPALEWDDLPTIDSKVIDAGRTFYSYIQGDVGYDQNTVIRNYDFYVSFYCDEEGKVT